MKTLYYSYHKTLDSVLSYGPGLLILIAFISLVYPQEVYSQDTTFAVAVESKTEEHPHFGEGNSSGYAINGEQGKELVLIRGITYEFETDGVGSFHPFYISTDPVGAGAGEYNDGVTNNNASDGTVLTFQPNDNAPDTLYYQCGNHQYMGYRLIIKDPASPGERNFVANLSGNQQVSTVVTSATGQVTATLDANNRLQLEGSFEGLTSEVNTDIAGGSHIHAAPAGVNGGVEIPLELTLNSDNMGGTYEASSNTYVLSNAQVEMLLDRKMYVNIHTMNYPSGEIRGQLMMEAESYYSAKLSGAKQVPMAVKSKGSGTVVAELHSDNMLVLSGAFADLESDLNTGLAGGTHVHDTLAGANTGVAFPLDVEASENMRAGVYKADSNMVELTASQASKLKNRMLYINVHSTNHAAGELRGQLLPQGRATFYSQLSSSSQNPPFESDGYGGVAIELKGDSLILSGTFANLESDFNADVAGGSHIHLAPAGRNGSVDIALDASVSSSMRAGNFKSSNNRFELDASAVGNLMTREYYINIHTAEHAGGSLRGQILPPADAYFKAKLSTRNQVPPFQATGTGEVIAEVRDSTVTLTGSFHGMASAFNSDVAGGSHIHMAAVGENGGVEVPISAQTGSNDTSGVYVTSDNTYQLNQTQTEALFEGNTYVNIHSMVHAGGELRGQLLLSPNKYPDSTMITTPDADTAEVEVDGLLSSTFDVEWNAASDTNGNKVGYIYQISPNTEFSGEHLMHISAGTDAGIQINFGILDTLLADIGVDVGTSDTLYHRVLSTDGSLQAQSETKVVVMTRGEVTAISEGNEVPDRTSLYANYPNPFNPSTQIQFSLNTTKEVELSVYNVLGKKVATLIDRQINSGRHSVNFDATGMSSGVYLYRLKTEEQTLTKKMMLVK